MLDGIVLIFIVSVPIIAIIVAVVFGGRALAKLEADEADREDE